MNEEIVKLFEGTGISEDFKSKLSSILEAKEQEITEAITEKYDTLAKEYESYIISEMQEKQDSYINEEVIPSIERYVDFVAESFVKENELVIESEVKCELADKFLNNIKSISEQYEIKIPTPRENAELISLKESLAETRKLVDTLLKEKEIFVKEKLTESVCSGLTDTQKERITKSASDVKFINEDQYKAALIELKESVIVKKRDNKTLVNENVSIKEHDSWLDALISKV